VSHQPERKEKNCLNCGATVVGRYCHVCGQENIVTKESFWSLTQHFVFDLLHFDGKFFHTLKYIFTRPGFVAREYCSGKRASYLHPIRMYLFTSAVFFLIFFSFNGLTTKESHATERLSREDRKELVEDYQKRLVKKPTDTVAQKIIGLLSDTTKDVTNSQVLALDPKPFFTISGRQYNTLEEYDSIQSALPAEQKDSRFRKMFARKAIKFNEENKDRPGEASKIFFGHLFHRLPYLLFLSLPFFALILKLLYIRRKNFYYSDHAIFTIYHYIFSFIVLLVFFGVDQLENRIGWSIFDYVMLAVFLAWPIYLLLEMKNFYRQGWLKTTGKFLLLNLLGAIVIFLLFLAFLLFSIFEL
jgi:hypothetical protein